MKIKIQKGRWALFLVLCTLIPSVFIIDAPCTSAKDTPTFRYGSHTDLSTVDASFIGIDGHYMNYAKGAIVKDVNGDGFDDLLFGAAIDKQVKDEAGKIYLFFGKEGGWAQNMSLDEADATFLGERLGGKAGYFISSAGDVNGDGLNDIWVSAAGDSEAGSDHGQVYLILGKKTGWGKNVSLAHVDASFLGGKENDNIAISLGQPGDVNGDGYDDIVFGSHMNGAYLILGKPTGWSMDTPISKADATFKDNDKNDDFGTITSIIGDVNGDGLDDLIVGSQNDYVSEMGKAYLFFGKRTGWSKDIETSSADVVLSGQPFLQVAKVGDANGDGIDDLLWGFPEYSLNITESFDYKLHLTFGKKGPWAKNLDENDDTVSFVVDDPVFVTHSFPDLALSGAGDVNKDGLDDLLFGIPNDNIGGDRAGQIYLVLGRSSIWPTTMSLKEANASFIGEFMGDQAGWGLSGEGDVNGDGYSDIYIASTEKGYLIFPMLGKPDKRPTLTEIGYQSTVEGKAFGYSVSATDEDGDPLTYSLSSAPEGMTIDQSGRISYTPTSQEGGLEETVVVSVSDGIKIATTQFQLKVVSHLPPMSVGPIMGEDGRPLDNATLVLSDGVQTRAATTDSAGKASVEIPSAWTSKNLTVVIRKTGWKETSLAGGVSNTGTFQPTGGSYPIVTKPIKTTVAGSHNILIIFIGMITLIVLIVKVREISERKF